jgi:hypothetical protein
MIRTLSKKDVPVSMHPKKIPPAEIIISGLRPDLSIKIVPRTVIGT